LIGSFAQELQKKDIKLVNLLLIYLFYVKLQAESTSRCLLKPSTSSSIQEYQVLTPMLNSQHGRLRIRTTTKGVVNLKDTQFLATI
jgi:hypothetical protein